MARLDGKVALISGAGRGIGAAIARIDRRLTVTLSTGDTISTDAVLFAAGRTPNTEGLGQDAFGVVGSRGHHRKEPR
jgi:pyruvate/2-oxoglutarate dehydrogenase complex dihydrolipoamide dehydrogenase (E3) component